MAKELTKTQRRILDYLVERKALNQLPPTLADIARHFGYKNRATVQQHLQALAKKNYINKSPKLSRGIELTIEDKFFITRPILGEVAAGNPLTIYPGAIDSIELPTVARMPKDSFLLRVKGDSLIDANIFNGDIVIVNPNIEPRNGQVVASVLDDAAVVKKFFRTNEAIELHSENKQYEPIIVNPNSDRFKLVGVVVGIYRSMVQ
ncbi:MAG: repressor LexA [Stygiobacter sp. RIFOXYC12_FULL_38_8]|nr:MAG: repressor LexA [Stygiobacter sp. GWC2_38_9]OGU81016.1 MAG: repressor LexA [Stygiobacter sp. RIFOXYA12_FULL_38_9]OGV06066.1 MAG: repressor LexA [Stygiobacter sp. RIFOXYB2_FULL_37_11]OGV10191.1 MAG: repressor LexA [Stygiobacter sp. RIFOXYA2_FULL_38_8]OGV16870.1 MAG: repressor LexA [Stygiobacter sp. RIFOXYC2_FULL_38_25]OGV28499.1 MAG: repressor LexA [Stygiobacter sp. RIFOXYC12_FULL_38_8]OGV82779.1 MAG: repressor LexA [Stygiobacter sp. GWF2_38_21]